MWLKKYTIIYALQTSKVETSPSFLSVFISYFISFCMKNECVNQYNKRKLDIKSWLILRYLLKYISR